MKFPIPQPIRDYLQTVQDSYSTPPSNSHDIATLQFHAESLKNNPLQTPPDNNFNQSDSK